MTRRGFLSALTVSIAPIAVPAQTGFHLRGRLLDDTSDLQLGYFAVCGTSTGQCKATDALGMSLHPNSPLYPLLTALVGKDIEITIHPI